MSQLSTETLTLVFDRGRRQRRRTYTGATYAMTRDHVHVTTADGAEQTYDTWTVTDVRSSTIHAPAAA